MANYAQAFGGDCELRNTNIQLHKLVFKHHIGVSLKGGIVAGSERNTKGNSPPVG